MSIASILGVALYALVILACAPAALAARKFPDRPGDLRHWLACAVIFAGLALLRLVEGEDRLRAIARALSRGSGEYAERAIVQVPLAILAALAALAIGWLFWRRWQANRPASRARLVIAARFALLALVPLYGLRLISLHQIDRLLYSGPLRLNWLIEGGLCLVVGAAALLYARKLRRRAVRIIPEKGLSGRP